jgi:NAD(P)-dependent dehydrogenase (short-subunit alcohol dehydrogenase family)
MKELVLPVPKMVSATYVVPVSTPMGTAEATQRASTAVKTRLTGPLRTLTAEWLAQGVVKIRVEAAGPPPSGWLDRKQFGTPEHR